MKSCKGVLGGGPNLRKKIQGGGVRLRFKRGLREEVDEKNTSDKDRNVQYSKKGFIQANLDERQSRKLTLQSTVRMQRYPSTSSETGDESSSPRLKDTREHPCSSTKKRRFYGSSRSRNQSPTPKRLRRSKSRDGERDVR